MLHQDLQRPGVPLWGYFAQISDSTTSYGSYSGAVPNEKITWGKLGEHTPKYIIESDAQASSLTRSIGEQYQLLDVPGTGGAGSEVSAELPPVP